MSPTRMRYSWPLAAGVTVLIIGCGTGNGPLPTVADAVYTNGKVVTVDGSSTVAQALAVKDGKFLAVGDSATISGHIGPGTQVVDLKGRTVIPGARRWCRGNAEASTAATLLKPRPAAASSVRGLGHRYCVTQLKLAATFTSPLPL